MADSPVDSIFGALNKLQERLSSTASSRHQFDLPQLTQLNDMVYEVHSPPPNEKPELEVVFLHGLQIGGWEHAYATTWMSRDNSQFWLKTWLVELFPKARIFTISYDSSSRRTQDSGRLDMYCTGENLVNSLTMDDVQIGQAGCPVVLVGHCLGGLVLKELCISAKWMVDRSGRQRLGVHRIRNLFSNLRGMFFYGTPHNGSLLGDELHNFCEGVLLEEITTLKASSARRNEEFNDLKLNHEWITAGIGESCETYVESIGRKIHVVPEASSRLYMDNYYSEPADHYDICKPEKKNASALILLKNFLNKIKDDGVPRAKALADAKSRREYTIDLGGRADQVISLLEQPNIKTVLIVGLSGIGKTTLAQQVFHDISNNFSTTCFVSLDTIERPSNFDEEVLTKILKALDLGSNHNFLEVPYLLESRKVLLVLDNVQSQEQLKALRTETWLEGSASKLIVTTTDARVGKSSRTFARSSGIFEVPYLSHLESFKLFRHFAFDGQQEPEDVRHLVSLVVKESENFPLSLKILAAYISYQDDPFDKQLWLDLLERLRKAHEVDGGHDYRLMAKLRLCYDDLSAPDKEIFLDIATFFNGYPLHWVKCIWKGCRDSPSVAWVNLQRRFLANEDAGGTIRMHTLLVNLGQSIACPQNSSLKKRTRISRSSVAKELIAEHQGNVDVPALVDVVALKLHIRQSDIFTLENTTFVNTRLEYLILEGARTSSGTVMELPKSLVYLRWKDASFTSCPVDFGRMEKLVVLEFIDCKFMEVFPRGVANARMLTWLDLAGCESLTELPSGLSTGLQYLGLDRTSLKELPSDLEKFTKLNELQAHRTKLTGVPQGVGSLQMLSLLDLSGSTVTSLPDSIGDLRQLIILDLRFTMVTSLPESIGGLQSLTELILLYTRLKSLPKSFGALRNLKRLLLGGTPLETLPDSFCELRRLSQLDLQNTQISRLPDAMGKLTALETLWVNSPSLKFWSEATSSLSRLKFLIVSVGALCENHAQSSESQLGIHSLLAQLPLLPALSELSLMGKGYPQHLLQPLFDALQKMPALDDLTLLDFNHLETIPSELGKLITLKRLVMSSLEKLRELPESLGQLRSLRNLVLKDLPSLCNLPAALSCCRTLSVLVIQRCGALESIPPPFNEETSDVRRSFDGRKSWARRVRRQLRLDLAESDSWSILEHFLDCCGKRSKHSARRIQYIVSCSEMERLKTKGFRRNGGYFLDIKDAMELFPKMDLHFRGRQNQSGSFHSSANCHVAPQFRMRCENKRHVGFHSGVRVMGIDGVNPDLDGEIADIDNDVEYIRDQEAERENMHVLRPF